MKEEAVYFDMDGVLADWVDGYKKIDYLPDLFVFNNLDKKEKEQLKKKFYTYEFFYNLKPINKGMALLKKYLKSHDKVVILTATGDINHKEVERAKLDWIKRYISKDIEVYFVKKVQYKYTKMLKNYKSHILIDDRKKSTDAWEQHGGKSILFK